MFDRLTVECKAGYKADETPVRFTLDEKERAVIEICDRWYGPDADFFKVKADDGYVYLLRHDRRTDEWSLRYVRIREPLTPPVPTPSDSGSLPH